LDERLRLMFACAYPAIDRRLSQYQPYWAARAELLARCGRTAGA
jgi:predicted RNA polymerase sigma factor